MFGSASSNLLKADDWSLDIHRERQLYISSLGYHIVFLSYWLPVPPRHTGKSELLNPCGLHEIPHYLAGCCLFGLMVSFLLTITSLVGSLSLFSVLFLHRCFLHYVCFCKNVLDWSVVVLKPHSRPCKQRPFKWRSLLKKSNSEYLYF